MPTHQTTNTGTRALARRLALLCLLLPYLISGMLKLLDFSSAQAEVAGLLGALVNEMALAPLTIAVIALQLGGSVLLWHGKRMAWLGGLALAMFTLAATFMAHTWWPLPLGPDRTHAFNSFWEHIALGGALVLAALGERAS
jgi:transmembrane protein